MNNYLPNKLEYLEKWTNFWTYNLPNWNHEDIEKLSRPRTSSKIESARKSLPSKERPGLEGFTAKFCQIFNKEFTSILLKLSPPKLKGILPNSFYKATTTLEPKPNNHTTTTKTIKQYL